MSTINRTTITATAQRLGYSRERIHQICRLHGFGEKITPGLWLLTEQEVRAIAKILSKMKIGRPKKILSESA